jgi:hypothetical protein
VILYLYAVVDELDDLTGMTGVADETLILLSLHDTSAVGGWMDAPPPIDRGHLEAQDAVVRQLHARAASLLPMRFGASFRSVADAERAFKTMSPGLRDRLAVARGREQMTIRVLRDPEAGVMSAAGAAGVMGATGAGAAGAVAGAAGVVGAAGAAGEVAGAAGDAPVGAASAAGGMGAAGAEGLPAMPGVLPAAAVLGVGARYLAERAARTTPPEIAPLLRALKPIQRATRVEAGRHSGVVATVYHLIDRGTDGTYRDAVASAAADLPTLIVRVTGPSPCYAFA